MYFFQNPSTGYPMVIDEREVFADPAMNDGNPRSDGYPPSDEDVADLKRWNDSVRALVPGPYKAAAIAAMVKVEGADVEGDCE